MRADANRAPIRRADRGVSGVLSSAEEEFWFLENLKPGDPRHVLVLPWRLRGPLDLGALQRALDGIVDRHEALRTRYASIDGEPKRVIDPPGGTRLERLDLGSTQGAGREDEARRRLLAVVNRPFDLDAGPLFRASLARLAEDDHVLALAVHHIAADGVALLILQEDLFALYVSARDGRAADLPELPIQYADHAVWQRGAEATADAAARVARWSEHLTGAKTLNLPTDRPRLAGNRAGAHRRFVVPAGLASGIRSLSLEVRAAPSTMLMTGFALLLARYSGQADFAMGTVMANRSREETRRVVGCFMSTLALRVQMNRDLTVRELIDDMHAELLLAYTHPDVRLHQVAKVLGGNRLDAAPIAALFIAQPSAHDAPLGEPPRVEPFDLDASQPKRFDLMLCTREQSDGTFGFTLFYSPDIFDVSTIDRMTSHFRQLLEGMVAHPDDRALELAVLPEPERRSIVVEWNETHRSYPHDATIHRLFEAQAERTPEAPAIVAGAARLTYRELDVRANALAKRLAAAGVRRGTLVGLCADRTAAVPVALLAILKAGGACVPLEPSYPRERLSVILEDARPHLVLVDAASEGALQAEAPRLRLDGLTEDVEEGRVESGVLSHDLMYVLYTSDSTGRPKGVEVTHRSVVNLLTSIRERTGFSSSDVLLAATSLSFDVAVLELYLPLITGATVVVADQTAVRDGRALLRLAEARGATFMQATPSGWRSVLTAGLVRAHGLRALTGGDAIPAKLARELAAATLDAWNVYGPTETTIWSTCWKIGAGVEQVSVGRPLANQTLYVLDSWMQPVPIGVLGELYVGGDGLARGYKGLPSKTADRFVPNPFAPGRLFRTGDVVRYLPDGNVEFQGRRDQQVKVRGHRIELGDIEAALLRQRGVRECAVVVHDDAGGEKRLVAFVVSDEARGHDDRLRSQLRGSLPEYMVPTLFVWLERLPLTPDGKVDRKALPAPDFTAVSLEDVATLNEVETVLAETWAQLLRGERVGVHDNFFARGGHSLLAMQLIARLRHRFSSEISLRTLFDAPTLEAFAEHVLEGLINDLKEEPDEPSASMR
jgi:amino acid adenylation domain-containing protein